MALGLIGHKHSTVRCRCTFGTSSPRVTMTLCATCTVLYAAGPSLMQAFEREHAGDHEQHLRTNDPTDCPAMFCAHPSDAG